VYVFVVDNDTPERLRGRRPNPLDEIPGPHHVLCYLIAYYKASPENVRQRPFSFDSSPIEFASSPVNGDAEPNVTDGLWFQTAWVFRSIDR
jgi:hypothetical protein